MRGLAVALSAVALLVGGCGSEPERTQPAKAKPAARSAQSFKSVADCQSKLAIGSSATNDKQMRKALRQLRKAIKTDKKLSKAFGQGKATVLCAADVDQLGG